MKFPRNARVFQGRLDVAPFASVFFLLLIFVLLGSILYTPGVHITLPFADDLPGVDGPTIAVAMDKTGHLYFQNQLVTETEFSNRLQQAARKTAKLTLVIQADKATAYDNLVHLALLARQAGISNALFATLPRVYSAPNSAAGSESGASQ